MFNKNSSPKKFLLKLRLGISIDSTYHSCYALHISSLILILSLHVLRAVHSGYLIFVFRYISRTSYIFDDVESEIKIFDLIKFVELWGFVLLYRESWNIICSTATTNIDIIHLFCVCSDRCIFTKLRKNRKILKRYISICTKCTYMRGWTLFLRYICYCKGHVIKSFVNCAHWMHFLYLIVKGI